MPGGGIVLNEKVFEIATARNALTVSPTLALELVRDLPDVPVMLETLLQLELEVGERAVDLGAMSQLVLSDLGASLQIMRLAGREESFSENRPARIEDCISGLGVQACLEAVSRRTFTRSSSRLEIFDIWSHSREIAESCRSIAETEFPSVHPDEAYLVGLFHAIGTLPEVFDWDLAASLPGDPALAGLKMAEAWALPNCVLAFFIARRTPKGTSPWTRIVDHAHQYAGFSLVECSSNDRLPVSKRSALAVQLV